MDINEMRSAVTLFSFFLFLGIWYWAYSKRNAKRFEQDGNLVFLGDTPEDAAARSESNPSKEG